jgi:release factor glutamine methyltransferase
VQGGILGEVEHFSSPACLLAEAGEIRFTVGDALIEAARHIPGETPRLEAEALLASLLGRPRGWLLAYPETLLSPEECEQYDAGVARLAAGEPLAYVTGRREFFGLEFFVNQHVLVPRPETEMLVEKALTAVRGLGVRGQGLGVRGYGPDSQEPDLRIANCELRIADIGTGSGCIAVSLAVHLPQAAILATDISAEALEVARTNATRHGVEARIQFRQGDLLAPLAAPVDLLCANLPYIDSNELTTLAVARHEPRLALDGGEGGLRLVERLLREAPRWVNPGGTVLLEIGATQAEAAAQLARAAFAGAAVAVQPDLASLPRLLVIVPNP